MQVGVATIQFAKAYGMSVLGTAGTPQGMEIARKAGASVVFNHRSDGYTDQIMVSNKGLDGFSKVDTKKEKCKLSREYHQNCPPL